MRQAAHAYRRANAASLPPLTAVCRALEAAGGQLHTAQELLAADNPDWRSAVLAAQDLLFELMAMTDASAEEGERLLTLYIYANQTLLTASLQADGEALAEIEAILTALHSDWQAVRESQVVAGHV
ncbi:flagellar protein FliS [Sporosarcina trichiuri]|nr:flagellar protein FliS [Sporosarcina sp. 0.2-SM1T-5]WJY29004.1 flagellar protein FliS [Sporosarcina sp. 0.2-SM1T-5]